MSFDIRHFTTSTRIITRYKIFPIIYGKLIKLTIPSYFRKRVHLSYLGQTQSLFCLKLFICETGLARLQPLRVVRTSENGDLLTYCCYSQVTQWPTHLQNHLDKHLSDDCCCFVFRTRKYSSTKCRNHKVMPVSFSVNLFFSNITSSLIFFCIKFVIFADF